MRVRALVSTLLSMAFLAGCLGGTEGGPTPGAADAGSAADDVVVVAVIDSGFNPYHWDFQADLMPQALDEDPSNDLPLDQDPSTWVPGFPAPSTFAGYEKLDLTETSGHPDFVPDKLHDDDASQWQKVKQSTPDAIHLSWIPGTKVIGAVTFDATDGYASGSHGVGTSSVSVGNLHGSCPHCLLVFVNGLGEDANRWVESQDWIDLQTNSWGFSSGVATRDRVYAGSDTESQRAAVDRGQSIFFSAGNGVDGAFVATNPTLFSSQEGPDWIVTVGAINPDGSSPGSGKPADIAGLGSDYPSAYGATNVTNGAGFGGTSNATPVTAGLYAEALHQLRQRMVGASRVQKDGVVSVGQLPCGEGRADCATADGSLTVHELREALFRSAIYTEPGWDVGGVTGPIPATNGPETTFLAEGHGTLYGKYLGDEEYTAQIARITGYAAGEWYEDQDPAQRDWFIADSLCRQGGWGEWEHGYAPAGTAAPASSDDWPVRTWMTEVCPTFLGAAVTAERAAPNANDLTIPPL